MRIKLNLPDTFIFSTEMAVRITDLNYGNHLGNHALLGMVHEARMRFIKFCGYESELDFGGTALIMADSAIVYKAEGFYSDVLQIDVTPAELHKYGFELYYRISNKQTGVEVAQAKTGMLCFNYQTRKIVPLPDAVRAKFES